ncbi:MAG TPA: tyrosine-type recombinase/integrase [Cyclobacteriaceae bacterium]|nr:tyrosine-type recombinase/integrase [Cyclobacteriaceae bacterium]HMV07877.1 tyrosine-type recombinase/integrase [Cyclobacteriaceae bacterium]HMV88145.1 tyrosine-type recombinase/integrase [Cyclobacteriaceae bacterium]HMW99011.1 tyrosine-type recombinase/integrase [Cyclobacteriaceae bacterium]HMX48355.1 tyrosine-type recombinase/integrase [Cyclobacteriaceae bacterium]
MIEQFLKYLQYEKRVSAHTSLAYRNDLEQFSKFLSETYDNHPVKDATYGMVRSWIITLVDAKIEASSVNRKIASLKAFYKFLLREQKIEKNPMQKIRVLKTQKRLPSFVKENDIAEVLDHKEYKKEKVDWSDSLEDWRRRVILELFYATGIRLSELIGLKENQINLRDRTIKVLGKRNKERVVPFPAGIVSILEGYKKVRNREVEMKNHGLLLVTDSGEPCYPMMVYRVVKQHLKESGSQKTSPHVLRHTYATHLLNKGAEINAVKDLLGHSSLAATQVYTHNSMEKIKKAFDQAHPKA